MDRRHFLASMAAGASLPVMALPPDSRQTTASGLIRPKVLRPGDTVGLVAPSTMVPDPDDLAAAARTIDYFGLRLKMGRNAGRRFGTYRESVAGRLDDLHAMFADSDVKAVFAIRGGYGASQLLDAIDYDLIRKNPKIFVGYSDITALHLAIHRQSKLVTFHGPVVLSAFSEYTQKSFRKALFDPAPLGRLANPPESNALRPAHPIRTIRPGVAAGPLIGGNLSLIADTMGTPFEIETAGRILCLEDVGEQPYRIDRMLMQQKLAGKLGTAAGLIVGECSDCGPADYKPSFASPYSLGEVLDNLLGDLKIPVFYGLTFGHTADQLTLPEGVGATMNAGEGTLEILESALLPA